MSLPAPNLDDRDFQQLVDAAKRHVQQRCPEWTDHNVSDPGITLLEAFAAMVDQLIYRLNRVPDRHYVKFLELIGVSLRPPAAARGEVTFWLSAPQPQPVVIRAGTEVATARTDVIDPVVFTTTEELVAQLAAGPTVTLGLTKWLLHAGRENTLDQQLRNEVFALELSSRTDDFREGLRAFGEKRDPDFQGR